jgi:putative ABC transport system permease protein
MVRLSTLWYFYRKRLRVHAMQELLAATGIAAGVALVFAVQVANTSIVASAREILQGITGSASLQLASRDTQGFNEAALSRVRALPGVERAAPVLEQRATIVFGDKRVAIELVGVDASLPTLGGITTQNLLIGGFGLARGIVLPSAVADSLKLPKPGADGGRPNAWLAVRGDSMPVSVLGVLDAGAIGPVAGAMMAALPLGYAQELTGLHDRITRVLVVPKAGREADVRAGLERMAAGRLKVASVDDETRLLDQATGPIDQATGLFAAISALVGLLFTFNAMLLTVPERRRFIAHLRIIGYRPRRIVQVLGFQAIALGAVASAVGLVAGYGLSLVAADDPPGYLSFAFPLGVEPVVAVHTVAIAFLGGVLATCLAAAQPFVDMRPGRAINAVFKQKGEPGHAVSAAVRRRLAVSAAALVLATTLLVLIVPSLTVLGVAALALATVLVIPAMFAAVLRAADVPARRLRINTLVVATRALRATSVRSLALAATGAVAVFGSVAIEGAHRNLLGGLDQNFADYLGTADLWVTSGGDENSLTTQSFGLDGALRRARAVPGVAQAYPYYGSMLDIGERRVWVIGRPRADRMLIPPSQLEEGTLGPANRMLHAGGWVAVSRAIAEQQDADIGDAISIPTPSGTRSYRVAAKLTNLGWGPGAVIMRADDYREAWRTRNPSAIEIRTQPGRDPVVVRQAVQDALDPRGLALRVQTTTARDAQFRALARQGLQRLSQISALLLIAAVLAMAAAMGAGIWQRRAAFAQFQIMGWKPRSLWHVLLFETGLVLGTGCMAGALVGVYGHVLGTRWMQLSTGYPAPFAITTWQTVTTCLVVGLTAIAVTAVPGWFVSRAPMRLGLRGNA